MAERRMFAKTIIDSDAFLDMPMSARLLYYDLSMRADDDGFINAPKKIMRMTGATQDDLSILALRKFIIPFESGVVVIKHWKIHNYIRKDTYSETKYKEEKATLMLDENNAYTQSSTSRLLSVDEPSTQDSIGKDRIVKDSIGKENIILPDSDEPEQTAPPKPKKAKPQKHKYGEYKNVLLTDEECSKLGNEYGKELAVQAIKFLDTYIEEKGYKSKSHYLAIRRWVIDAVKVREKAQPRNTAKSSGNPFLDIAIDENLM